jgi:hypothetical protein
MGESFDDVYCAERGARFFDSACSTNWRLYGTFALPLVRRGLCHRQDLAAAAQPSQKR